MTALIAAHVLALAMWAQQPYNGYGGYMSLQGDAVVLGTPVQVWSNLPVTTWGTPPKRSHVVTRQFQRLHPCPANGKPTGPCKGYIRDHIVPLRCGGQDVVSNLQWQSVADAKMKDKTERRCTR